MSDTREKEPNNHYELIKAEVREGRLWLYGRTVGTEKMWTWSFPIEDAVEIVDAVMSAFLGGGEGL